MAGTGRVGIRMASGVCRYRDSGRIPAFEEMEPDVKTAWLAEQKTTAWQKAYADMRAKYSVMLPAAPSEAAQAPATQPGMKKQVPASSGEGPL